MFFMKQAFSDFNFEKLSQSPVIATQVILAFLLELLGTVRARKHRVGLRF